RPRRSAHARALLPTRPLPRSPPRVRVRRARGAPGHRIRGLDELGLREVAFECRSIDDLVAELGLDRVDLVKLDVEGAEPFVLEGMRRTLATHRPQLAISI